MKKILLFVMLLVPFGLTAQDDLLGMLDSVAPPHTDVTTATFKATRIVTGHSVERMKEGQLEFRISHRFGRMNTGVDNFFGLDESNISLCLEYGITDWLEIGVQRTSRDKIVEGFTKLSLLRQSSGASWMPVTISYVGAIDINTMPWQYPERNNYFTSRLTFVHQILLARKITEELSLQISPSFFHRNMVATEFDENDEYAFGIGGRYKLSNRISINAEYFYVYRPDKRTTGDNSTSGFTNPISVGLDIETGGHVFQLMLSNSRGMIDKHYITETTGLMNKGDIHLGFNISRVFTLFGE
ncbi:MAG: hypothetical protein HW421_2964 [Ignavibacteria bacterium]|nr:hypothetical protein [Ignavibacteria bacterium]